LTLLTQQLTLQNSTATELNSLTLQNSTVDAKELNSRRYKTPQLTLMGVFSESLGAQPPKFNEY